MHHLLWPFMLKLNMDLINPHLVSIITHSQGLTLAFLLFITTFIVLLKAHLHRNVQEYDFQFTRMMYVERLRVELSY